MDKLLKRTPNEKIRTQRYPSRSYYSLLAETTLSNPNLKVYVGHMWIKIQLKIIKNL